MRKGVLPLFLMLAVLVGLANSVRVFADPGSTATKPGFTIWKTIQLGTHKNAKSLKKDVERNSFKVSDWAADIMAKPAFKVAMEKTSVDLVNVSVGQLGFTKATLLRDIYARAIELGLSLCPAEVGPQLRLQYADQPSGEWLRVAMKAITASDGRPSIFFVAAHGGGVRWLSAGWGSSGDTWAPDDRFVFGKNSKSGTT